MGEIGPGGRDGSSPAGHEDRRVGAEKDLTVVLKEAAALAAELAVEIGEPVPSALTDLRPGSAGLGDVAPLEDAADLDTQLANLQVLVDDAAAGMETPPETLGTDLDEPVSDAPTKDESSHAPKPGTEGQQDAPASDPPALGDPAPEAKTGAPAGVVGNIPRPPSLEAPPVQKPAVEKTTEVSRSVSSGRRVRAAVVGIALSAGDACARFLELIDEPFQFVGWRPRVVIGWFALATVGASVIVAILAMLL